MKMCTLLAGLMIPGLAVAGVSASSELKDSDGERHPAAHAVDGLLSTGWAEGDDTDGTGAWLDLRLDRTTEVRSVSIWPGNLAQGSRGLREHGRPHTVSITLIGGDEEVTEQVRILDIGDTGPARVDVPIRGTAKSIRITLDEVYKGGIYNDTWITEVAVNFYGGTDHPSLGKLQTWMAGDAALEAAGEHAEQVKGYKDAISAEDFGDRESLEALKAAAADGPAYLQKQVAKMVPDGYRMLALPPSQPAMNTLLELEDPNAIAGLELAAIRSQGELQAALVDRVSRFNAFRDLKGGPKRNVKAFGEPGFCEGCLRSFGEPLDVGVDAFGGVWVSDIGNHRIQKFSFDGINMMVVGGGEPAISNKWLASHRDWYATGATPGAEDGSFMLPLSIDILPNKKAGDSAVVLDASGKITVVNAQGAVVRSWSLGVDDPVSGGVGGEAHLTVAGKKIVAVWGNEGFAFDLEGTALSTFDIEDGVPGGIVGFKNGKVGLMFADSMVLYSPDGFRHGEILADTIPDGFEYWDAALDEKGKLWVVTDTGWAIKYKKPGTVDYQTKITTYSLEIPRFDVYQDMLFVSDRNALLKVDALKKKAIGDAGSDL